MTKYFSLLMGLLIKIKCWWLGHKLYDITERPTIIHVRKCYCKRCGRIFAYTQWGLCKWNDNFYDDLMF
jgi:hypothetical protein